ncbi:hypothetical protein CL632_02420 [bacterium]|jgi:hypothetical protein|nr:hypothetical protein [bacterium]|tara:strand:+ start:3867 stop:4811 length:945 start_codon:yes stop_codon:yes gene_type:complete
MSNTSKKTINQLLIAPLGVFDLSLPVIRFGTGSPRVLIINNLHGNELTGFYVLEKLVSNLPKDVKGSLTILLSANPLGLIHKQRFLPLDNIDLNRGYPNPPQARGINSKLKEELVKLGLEHDIILDLHTFMRPCLSAALLLPHRKTDQQKVKKYLSTLNTEIIIPMNIKQQEKRVESSLGIHLIKQGKIFLAAEYPPVRCITEKQITHYQQGLKNLLQTIGVFADKKTSTTQCPPMLERQQVIGSCTGLFTPKQDIGAKVNMNDLLGDFIDIKTLSKTPLISPFSGILTELADREFYIYGEKMATIGKHIKKSN